MGGLFGVITKFGPWAKSFSYASVSGFLDMLMSHLEVDFGTVDVVAVGLEMTVLPCAVDAVAVWLKLYINRAIKEAIYIRVNNPSLNRNIGKYHLPHIWDEVLLNISELKLK